MGDQWGRVEKRLIELEREWERKGGRGRKEDKNGGEREREGGTIEKAEEGREGRRGFLQLAVSPELKGDGNNAGQSIVTAGALPVTLAHKGKSRGIGNTKNGACKRNTAPWPAPVASVSRAGWFVCNVFQPDCTHSPITWV